MSIAKRLYYEPYTNNADYHLHSLSKVTVQNKSDQPRHRFGGDFTNYYMGTKPGMKKQVLPRSVRSRMSGRGHSKKDNEEIKKVVAELQGAVKAHTSQANRLKKIAK